jgi:hypothetical protein
VLVHFFDFAQLNSVRTLPYITEWERRYRAAGLTVLGVHTPRHPFTAAPEALEPALVRLGIEHPVADDSSHALWHDYGCRGWPSLFLWGRGSVLRWFHFGEGEYRDTELAIQEELGTLPQAAELPEPLAPLRPTDAPGAVVAAPTPEVFPGGSPAEPWTGGSEELVFDYAAGGAYAAVDGEGELLVAIDADPPRALAVADPGLLELHSDARHAEHAITLRAGPGVRVWALAFAAGVP